MTQTHIPLGQIEEARASFGAARLSFEVELVATNLLDGLEEFGRVCRQSGLAPHRLRCEENGRLSCALTLHDESDLTALTTMKPVLSVDRWTTIIAI